MRSLKFEKIHTLIVKVVYTHIHAHMHACTHTVKHTWKGCPGTRDCGYGIQRGRRMLPGVKEIFRILFYILVVSLQVSKFIKLCTKIRVI